MLEYHAGTPINIGSVMQYVAFYFYGALHNQNQEYSRLNETGKVFKDCQNVLANRVIPTLNKHMLLYPIDEGTGLFSTIS